MSEWFEDESFWSGLYPHMFPQSRMEKAEVDADHIIALTGVSGGRLLDLCCGPGRFSTAFARRGFMVTGVDSTDCLLRTARSRAQAEDISVEWVSMDMRSFRRKGYFHLAINMFTSFGYFSSHSDNLRVLLNLRESLRPGGTVLLEMMGKEVLASIFSPVTLTEVGDGNMLVQKHSVEDGWRRIVNDWILLSEDGVERRWRFSHWVYSASELESMLLEAGFGNISFYGDLEGSPYDTTAGRLVAVASAG